MNVEAAVLQYQCPGCVGGPGPKCYRTKNGEHACSNHCAGTTISGIGRVFLGMPKGFNRLGSCDETKIFIFKTRDEFWGYDEFNIPTWKHLDKYGNTLVRVYCPRINYPLIHIYLCDCMSQIDCLEITQADMDEMD